MQTKSGLDMHISQVIERFITACQAARYSPHTLLDYENTFRKLIAAVGDPKMRDVGADCIARFLAGQAGLSAKTLLNYHTGLSSLWRWAVAHGYAPANIVRMVKPPKPEKVQILPYTKTDVLRLLDAAQTGPTPLRDRAILLTLLDTGVRASELCRLRILDADLEHGALLIHGKGARQRLVHISQSCQGAILDYVQARGIRNRHKQRYWPVFATIQGHPYNRLALLQRLGRLGSQAGVTGCHAHRFRHTFAIEFLRNGGNIYTLQNMLGHSTLDMVKRYLAIAQIDLARDHARASPVAGWGL